VQNHQSAITISQQTKCRFIMGKQGLYPGRRWRTVAEAMAEHAVIQIDPLNIIARSHEISLYTRVQNYQQGNLDEYLYNERGGFDWGGVVTIFPMDELPYMRVIMERKCHQKRWTEFSSQAPEVIELVRNRLQEQGGLLNRDFNEGIVTVGNFRSGKATGQALYYLWLAGEVMTHHRKGIERVYDLTERVAPPHLQYTASPEEADGYYALKAWGELGMMSAKSWRNWFQGAIERKVDLIETDRRLTTLLNAGKIIPITLAKDPKTPRYILAEDLPLLQMLEEGDIPDQWKPLTTTTDEEMVVLAPLEIVSARGRAKLLFDFEYIWEVYKPETKRRWGYYTMPLLYRDKLVARFDSKLERPNQTLLIKGFWVEDEVKVDTDFMDALNNGLATFKRFVGANTLAWGDKVPDEIRHGVMTH
jgi:uncharacterized protein